MSNLFKKKKKKKVNAAPCRLRSWSGCMYVCIVLQLLANGKSKPALLNAHVKRSQAVANQSREISTTELVKTKSYYITAIS